jgi:FKBP-type peptidyl-prolyl cis-trans isomerase
MNTIKKHDFLSWVYLTTLFSFILIISISCKKETPQSEVDHGLIEAYVQENQLNGEFTDSGLYYVISVPGGNTHPNLNSSVTVTYDGYTLNDDPIDDGSFITFKLSQLITGWQEGIPLIGTGGKIKLIIPSDQAYGKEVLVFDITLHYFSK